MKNIPVQVQTKFMRCVAITMHHVMFASLFSHECCMQWLIINIYRYNWERKKYCYFSLTVWICIEDNPFLSVYYSQTKLKHLSNSAILLILHQYSHLMCTNVGVVLKLAEPLSIPHHITYYHFTCVLMAGIQHS